MKKLYFIRHGLSELNVKGLYAGHTETPLTDEGRRQAKKAGRDATGLNIDLIVSSPLGRALETAQLAAKEIGYPEDKIIVDDRLIERHFGELEAQPYSPHHSEDHRLQHGAETSEKLIDRVRGFLDWLESQQADNILVVSHGSTGRALRSLIKEDFPFSHPSHLGNAELYEWL